LYKCENQRNIKQGNIVRKYTDWRDSERQVLLAKNRKESKRNSGRPGIFNVYWTVHHCNSWRMKDQL